MKKVTTKQKQIFWRKHFIWKRL